MRTGLNAIGAMLVVIGLVWAGQGANLIGGSFMTGKRLWLTIGSVVVLTGVGVLVQANLRPRRP